MFHSIPNTFCLGVSCCSSRTSFHSLFSFLHGVLPINVIYSNVNLYRQWIYGHIYVYIIYVYMFIYTYMYMYMCVCAYKYKFRHTHTHMHTSCRPPRSDDIFLGGSTQELPRRWRRARSCCGKAWDLIYLWCIPQKDRSGSVFHESIIFYLFL